jgi:hypothetical protein
MVANCTLLWQVYGKRLNGLLYPTRAYLVGYVGLFSAKERKGKAMSVVRRLREKGFDLSYNVRFSRAWKVRCSQCAACTINGAACHERGCYNAHKAEREAVEAGGCI